MDMTVGIASYLGGVTVAVVVGVLLIVLTRVLENKHKNERH